MEQRALKVHREQPGRKERPGQQVLKVHREQLDHKALRVRPEQTDLLAPKGRKERRDHKVLKDRPDRTVDW